MGTSVILLAYKEAENLKVMLPKLHDIFDKMKEQYEILVIDSAKPQDNTEEVCKELNARYIPQEGPAYGGAFRTGIKYAKYNKIQVLDADQSHDPEDIPTIHQKFNEGYDMVIGSRYTKGGVTQDSKTSFILSKILNTVMRVVVGVKAKDISTSYRLYDAKQLKDVTLERDNYEILQEVILKMKLNNSHFKIGEIPIVFHKRAFGESKRSFFKFAIGYAATVFMLTKMRMQRTSNKGGTL